MIINFKARPLVFFILSCYQPWLRTSLLLQDLTGCHFFVNIPLLQFGNRNTGSFPAFFQVPGQDRRQAPPREDVYDQAPPNIQAKKLRSGPGSKAIIRVCSFVLLNTLIFLNFVPVQGYLEYSNIQF